MSPSICCRCNEEIWPRAINSLGKSYHPHHFTCTECGLVVDPKLFFAVADVSQSVGVHAVGERMQHLFLIHFASGFQMLRFHGRNLSVCAQQ